MFASCALEDKLATLRRAGHDLAAQQARRPAALTPGELDWITRAGADVKAIFHTRPPRPENANS